MNQVFKAVSDEREYQDSKWGTIEEHPHEVGSWLLVIKGELDEAIEAWQKGGGDRLALQEVVQVAATSFACLEQHGLGFPRDFSTQGREKYLDMLRKRRMGV